MPDPAPRSAHNRCAMVRVAQMWAPAVDFHGCVVRAGVAASVRFVYPAG